MGSSLEELLRPRKTVIRWKNEDWDALAQLVHKKRGRYPDKSLVVLANEAQKADEWDKERKRKITAMNQIMPLVPRMRKIDEQISVDLFEQRQKIEQQDEALGHFRSAPTKDQILEQMPEEEICRRYTAKVITHLSAEDVLAHFDSNVILTGIPLDQVFAFVGRELISNVAMMQTQLANHIAHHPTAAPANSKLNGNGKHAVAAPKARIAFVGFQQRQMDILKSHVGHRAEVVFIPKASRKDECNIANDFLFVVVAEAFTPPVQKIAVQQQVKHERLIMHRGTLNELVQRLPDVPLFKALKH